MDQDKNFVDNKIIDLANSQYSAENKLLTIRAIVHPEDYQINSKEYYQREKIPEIIENYESK
ncbi:hypothetical protein [Methyloprofundus sp.]|uniref:hypothetical protein n=1 Tax=Methyloprofundus sp. TaxID=2020875 RepID=UPI003D0A3E6E